MENLSFNEICEMSIRQINAHFRKNDDSHLWPIRGRFNATERAIRRIRKRRREGLDCNSGYEYYLTLENEITEIVNDPKL